MKVKFKNGEVDLYKLRKGTVVVQDEGLKTTALNIYHIEEFIGTGFAENTVDMIVVDSRDSYEVNSADMTWVEPF